MKAGEKIGRKAGVERREEKREKKEKREKREKREALNQRTVSHAIIFYRVFYR
jgi:hypothetical protein